MTAVETVRGPVAAGDLGRTLAHEHVFNVDAELQRDFPDLSWQGSRAQAIAYVAGKLTEIKARGIDTLIDASAIGHSRDVRALAEANAEADINIVVSTGLYTHDALPWFYRSRPPERGADGKLKDVMVDMFVRDITLGVQGTDIKAALIKCVTDKEGVTANVDRILRATARAHRETGAPITTHSDCETRNGLNQQRIFAEEGVKLDRVVIGHAGDSDDFDYLQRLLDAGSFIGCDRFGFYMPGRPTMEQRIDTVVQLCQRGYAGQILLAHDASIYTDWFPVLPQVWPVLPAQWTQTHIPDEVLPAIRQRGISDAQIHQMLVDNPRRLLENNEAY
ncbi:phosphotriesterase [Streptomyces sp. NPDC008092]|uniref:phosphotriesterase family protein n=1 Tax=Streptomyces sp. NPDC008092 TaxID=3364808 RepID=UPI0036E9EFC1